MRKKVDENELTSFTLYRKVSASLLTNAKQNEHKNLKGDFMPSKTLMTMITFYSLVLLFVASIVALSRRPQWWPHLLMTFLGFLVGMMSLRTDDVPVILFFLLAFGFFGGFAEAGRAWLLALLLAVWTPALNVLSQAIGGFQDHYTVAGPFIAFIPAFAGTYLGAFIKRTSAKSIRAV